MVRFIFVCMGIVALSVLTIASQFMMNGIEGTQEQIAARNDAVPAEDVAAIESEPTAEDLNAIETAAGANDAINAPGNQTFGDVFTTEAPTALKEPSAVMEADMLPVEGASQ